MDMEQFKAQLKELAGKDGEKAWKLVEDWYTGDGNARRLSLHDLHELSQAVVLYADEIRRECAAEIDKLKNLLAWAMTYVDANQDMGMTLPTERKMAEKARQAIIGKEAGE